MPYGEPDHDDPMEFMGVVLPALSAEEEDEMVRCVIEEYCWLGWDERELWRLFTHPFYQATHQFYTERGEQHVGRLLEEVLGHPVQPPGPAFATAGIKVLLPVIQ